MRATRFVVIPTRAILEEFHIYFKFIQNELISFKWEKKKKTKKQHKFTPWNRFFKMRFQYKHNL